MNRITVLRVALVVLIAIAVCRNRCACHAKVEVDQGNDHSDGAYDDREESMDNDYMLQLMVHPPGPYENRVELMKVELSLLFIAPPSHDSMEDINRFMSTFREHSNATIRMDYETQVVYDDVFEKLEFSFRHEGIYPLEARVCNLHRCWYSEVVMYNTCRGGTDLSQWNEYVPDVAMEKKYLTSNSGLIGVTLRHDVSFEDTHFEIPSPEALGFPLGLGRSRGLAHYAFCVFMDRHLQLPPHGDGSNTFYNDKCFMYDSSNADENVRIPMSMCPKQITILYLQMHSDTVFYKYTAMFSNNPGCGGQAGTDAVSIDMMTDGMDGWREPTDDQISESHINPSHTSNPNEAPRVPLRVGAVFDASKSHGYDTLGLLAAKRMAEMNALYAVEVFTIGTEGEQETQDAMIDKLALMDVVLDLNSYRNYQYDPEDVVSTQYTHVFQDIARKISTQNPRSRPAIVSFVDKNEDRSALPFGYPVDAIIVPSKLFLNGLSVNINSPTFVLPPSLSMTQVGSKQRDTCEEGQAFTVLHVVTDDEDFEGPLLTLAVIKALMKHMENPNASIKFLLIAPNSMIPMLKRFLPKKHPRVRVQLKPLNPDYEMTCDPLDEASAGAKVAEEFAYIEREVTNVNAVMMVGNINSHPYVVGGVAYANGIPVISLPTTDIGALPHQDADRMGLKFGQGMRELLDTCRADGPNDCKEAVVYLLQALNEVWVAASERGFCGGAPSDPMDAMQEHVYDRLHTWMHDQVLFVRCLDAEGTLGNLSVCSQVSSTSSSSSASASSFKSVIEELDLRDGIARFNAANLQGSSRGSDASSIYNAHERWQRGDYPDVRVPGYGVDDVSNRVLTHIIEAPPPSTVNASYTPPQHTQRILCVMHTHEGRHEQVRAALDTWGKRCDGFVSASNATDISVSAVKFPQRGPEYLDDGSPNLWQKIRGALWTLHTYAHDEYDWVVVCDDSTYLWIDKLRDYLESSEIRRAEATWGSESREQALPMYGGVRMTYNSGLMYNNGRAGYMLNKRAMGFLVDHIARGLCFPHADTSAADVLLGSCVLAAAGVSPIDTTDMLRQPRFHALDMKRRYAGVSASPTLRGEDVSRWSFGRKCCSQDSVSFGSVDNPLMLRIVHDRAMSKTST